jgi:hypothetical protein
LGAKVRKIVCSTKEIFPFFADTPSDSVVCIGILPQNVLHFAANRVAYCGKMRGVLRQNAALFCDKKGGRFAAKRHFKEKTWRKAWTLHIFFIYLHP